MSDHVSKDSLAPHPMPPTPLWSRWWIFALALFFGLLLWFMVNLFFFSQSPLESASHSSPDSAPSPVTTTDIGQSAQRAPARKATPSTASTPHDSQQSTQGSTPQPTNTTAASSPQETENQRETEPSPQPRNDAASPVVWADSLFGSSFPIDRQSLQQTLGMDDLEVTDFFIASPGTHAVLQTVTAQGQRYTLWAARHHAWEPDTTTPGGMPWDSSDIPWRVNGIVPHSGNVEAGGMYAGGTIELSFSDGSVYYSDDIGASWYQQ